MLSEKPEVETEYQLSALDSVELQERYQNVLTQAHMLDEALKLLKREGGLALPRSISLLALLWAQYDLDLDYRFRHNEARVHGEDLEPLGSLI